MLRLAKKYGPSRLESACQKAVQVGGFAFRTLELLLLHNLDQVARSPTEERKVLHLNIRGADYYSEADKEEEHVDASDTGEIEGPEAAGHA